MNRLDFYVLQGQTANTYLSFVCRLIEKAYKQKHHIYIHTDSLEMNRRLDELLWTFRDVSFIPHQVIEEQTPATAPIQIGQQIAADMPRDILINLATVVPNFYADFSRVIEIVLEVEPWRSDARKKYQFYREQGCQIETHKV